MSDLLAHRSKSNMHNSSFDLTLDQITKIEGAAGLDVSVRGGKVVDLRLKLSEYKRFYTQGVRGKSVPAVPQLLARICGTCSNAHILCSIEACEKALGIVPSAQTMIMRRLAINGLMIRDHGLHLYVFALPDLLGKDSILELDENNPKEKQFLEDTFCVKKAGNMLSVAFGGRSVHAPYLTIGGFLKFPSADDLTGCKNFLIKARPAAQRLVKLFSDSQFKFYDQTNFVGLIGENRYDFLEGKIKTSKDGVIEEANFRQHLEHQVIPYSQASGYKFKRETYMVGALARVNLAKEKLNENTIKNVGYVLSRFPSTNVFDNNLAQAIEILHCIDDSLLLLGSNQFNPEKPASTQKKDGVGVGVIEAPRGTLYHMLEIKDNKVARAEIIVPTGQNQISIEKNLVRLVEENIDLDKEQLSHEIEKFVRAYDPCISCATHFLKINFH